MADTIVGWLNDNLTWVLIFALLAAGLYFTILTKGVQFRLFGAMWKVIFKSRGNAEGGISSFQAFCISLASRVGTGNIVGVAIALTLGGPGAIFWMWLMALLGMATAFTEATLAQLYKIPHPEDKTFIGGPAYYIQRGLKSRPVGIVFAACLIFTFGFAFQMVQSNTISGVVEGTWGIDPLWTALGVAALTAAVIFGGIKSVARVTEIMAPGMALVYVLLALAVLVLRAPEVPGAIGEIFAGAFGLNEALAGTAGGVIAAMLNGVKRGMFSNEAGMGSAPNAAATATTRHPVNQGLIQSAGVFVDTILVCTATAVMIILAAPEIYTPGVTESSVAATLTQSALASELGAWVTPVMALLIFVFAYSSVLGNYTYAEVNQDFIGGGRVGNILLRCLIVVAVFWGGIQELAFVWSVADVAMSVMAVINLGALFLLGKRAAGALRDFESQKGVALEDRSFDLAGNPYLPDDIPGEVWHSEHSGTAKAEV
ncbi:alanine/glycine:cation symporter family protein [Micropruina sonneratiae]|uniref:alanine/glycine:cation symporter family protein n=1 Tax=Micropruina sonneratiae TaxID=2986940 RepID=UPI002226F78F|nr:alanine/glycine:cation symporter family protein [Micropruina sp. KQZ13P-5]MCW3159106.1 alanine:cation symporter family protein [Micropruina sp. KQZ13P-5]